MELYFLCPMIIQSYFFPCFLLGPLYIISCGNLLATTICIYVIANCTINIYFLFVFLTNQNAVMQKHDLLDIHIYYR